MNDRVILTERLVMAPHERDDFGDMAAMWADPAVVRFLGGAVASNEDSWARLLRYVGSWALLGYGFWAVRRRDDGVFLGDVGFLDGRRTGVDGFDGDPEIGWSLNVAAHGKGYASEAVVAALGWGATRFGRCVAMIDPENAASTALARRCEFQRFAEGRYKDAPTGLWEYRWKV